MNNQQAYVRKLRARTKGIRDYEVVSRDYPNLAGASEIIFLPRCYWNYVDWAEARGEMDFAGWVIHCEKNPHEDMPISELLMYWLWQDICSRWMNCLPTMLDVPPQGFAFWKATYGKKVWTVGYGGS